jgi:hypothetical protein
VQFTGLFGSVGDSGGAFALLVDVERLLSPTFLPDGSVLDCRGFLGHAAISQWQDEGDPVSADAELTTVLGAVPPDSVRALPAGTLNRLAEQIDEAKKRQDADLEKSVQVAIAGVPFAVRGIVRKALT